MATISDLAAAIAANTAKVENYLSEHHLACPTLTSSSEAAWSIPQDMNEIREVQQAILRDTTELQERMQGPTAYIRSLADCSPFTIFDTITRFKVVQAVPLNGEIGIHELAKKCNMNEDQLARIMRYAVASKIFQYSETGGICHNLVSKNLADDDLLLGYVNSACQDMYPAMFATATAMQRHPGSQNIEDCGFAVANSTTSSIFDVHAQNSERASNFSKAMQLFAKNDTTALSFVVENYPWVDIGKGTIVDIGGSQGHISMHLAEQFPEPSFIVQDLPTVLQSAVIPPKLAERVKLMPHDFFSPQPVQADVYFFRWIIHDWSDRYAVKILQALIPALRSGSRVVICDEVLPPQGTLPPQLELAYCNMDISMMALLNGKVRTIEGWKELFRSADERFVFQFVRQVHPSLKAMMEWVWMS